MLLDGKLHVSPLKPDIQNVLDVGTGTAAWSIEFADSYPSAKVVGTDLSPIQPVFVPPNCSFLVEDSESDWQWEEKFDFIHSRALASSWRDWRRYFWQCYEQLAPGGYLELHEFTFPFRCDDETAAPDNPMMEWSRLFSEACAKASVDMGLCARLDPLLRDAGFAEVTKVRKRQAFGGWSEDRDEREGGTFYGRVFDWSISMALFIRRLGWKREEVELFLMDVRKAAADPGCHVYIPV